MDNITSLIIALLSFAFGLAIGNFTGYYVSSKNILKKLKKRLFDGKLP